MHRKLGQKKPGKIQLMVGQSILLKAGQFFILHSNVPSSWKRCKILPESSVNQHQKKMSKSTERKKKFVVIACLTVKGISKKRS